MKRRSSLPAAAASTAAVPETSASANSQVMNAPDQAGPFPIPKGFEIDLADPQEHNYRKAFNIELFARLEEFYADDAPGQLSGSVLRIVEGGPRITINAELSRVRQPYGGENCHLLGHLNPASVRRFVDEAEAGAAIAIGLRESYSDSRQEKFSGATLAFSGGGRPELQLCFGAHCLGALRNDLLAKFLTCVRTRIELEIE